VAKFTYLGTRVTNQNLIQKKIKSRLNSGNACYDSVQKLLSSGLLTWSLTLREEQRLRVFENSVMSGIFGLKRDEVIGGCRKLHNEELHDLYSSPSIVRIIKPKRMRWQGM
jgi:hypothetical protein